MSEEIINRVQNSGLIQIDLEDLLGNPEIVAFDLKENLFQGLVLKEKDFRSYLKEHNWSQYTGKNVAVYCSTDAIIPTWAYMLVISYLDQYAEKAIAGSPDQMIQYLFFEKLAELDLKKFTDAKVVIKGCASLPISPLCYGELTKVLLPYAKSIMFGEPCSTVPVYKKKLKK